MTNTVHHSLSLNIIKEMERFESQILNELEV